MVRLDTPLVEAEADAFLGRRFSGPQRGSAATPRRIVDAVADVDARLCFAEQPIDDSADEMTGNSRAYLSDPDGIGIELYYDRPRADWFDENGRPIIRADRFDVRELLPDADLAATGR